MDIPERPDLKMGGAGPDRWIEIDFFWEREGVANLLNQPERHTDWTRRVELARDEVLRGLGIVVIRIDRDELDARLLETKRVLMQRRATYRPPYRASDSSGMPQINVSRTLAWLAGEPGAPATPPGWPHHFDHGLVTWDRHPVAGIR